MMNDAMVLRFLKNSKDRLERIKNICYTKKYKICFAGKVGIGKSTMICSLLGMIETEGCEGKKPEDISLLKTGSGRTTVCEVEISQVDEETNITIEAIDGLKVEMYIKNFSDYISGEKLESESLAQEEINLMRHMCGMEKFDREKIYNMINTTGVSVDEYIIERLNYADRNINKLIFDKEKISLAEWLKKSFKMINDGNSKDIPIPKRIIINLNSNDFNMDLPEYISGVIDTKGIDGDGRSDIGEYMKSDKLITIFCDEVKGIAGDADTLNILKDNLIKEDKYTKNKVILLGLDKAGDLENDSIKEGKISEVIASFRKYDVSFKSENILFSNSLPGIVVQNKSKIINGKEETRKLIVEFDYEVKEYKRKKLFSDIEVCLNNMYKKLFLEVCEIEKNIECFLGEELDTDIKEKLNKCMIKLEEKKKACKVGSIQEEFETEILNIHPSSLRGAINHLGYGNTVNIYGVFKRSVGKVFDDANRDAKIEIVATVESILSGAKDIDKVCKNIILDKINDCYTEYYNKYRDEFTEILEEKLYNIKAWEKLMTYWGAGLNYKCVVCRDIINMLDEYNINKYITTYNIESEFWNSLISFMTLK